MDYEPLITKILGEHTEREGEVASLVLDFVAKNPDWRGKELKLYEDKIVRIMSDVLVAMYGQPLSAFLDKSRDWDKVAVRQMACLFLRENTTFSLHKIAKIIGRDHATVVHSINCARDRMVWEKGFCENYETFKNTCLEKI